MATDIDLLKRIRAVQSWIVPTPTNSWVNYDGTFNQLGYMKDPSGFVHLRGLVKNGSSGNAAIFTLPVGYRPQYQCLFCCMTNGPAACRVDVSTAGVVTPTGASTTWLSLDNIVFKAFQ